MFNFIRGMFDKSSSTCSFNLHPSSDSPSVHDFYVHVFPKFPSEDSPYLTKAELQMLQRIVANEICTEEEYRNDTKILATEAPKNSEDRDYWYKRVAKSSSKIKKLSQMQYRLKHRIIAKG